MKWIEAVPAPNKSCGSCSLCCKLFEIDWLEKPKPAGKWCHHCTPGKGCAIWQDVPKKCADYYCVWRLDPDLGAEWKPEAARFILTHASPEAPLTVLNDPVFPDAHRREPYRSELAKTARTILEGRGSTIVVFTGRKRALIFPDCEIPIPEGVELHEIHIRVEDSPAGRVWRPVFPATGERSAVA